MMILFVIFLKLKHCNYSFSAISLGKFIREFLSSFTVTVQQEI